MRTVQPDDYSQGEAPDDIPVHEESAIDVSAEQHFSDSIYRGNDSLRHWIAEKARAKKEHRDTLQYVPHIERCAKRMVMARVHDRGGRKPRAHRPELPPYKCRCRECRALEYENRKKGRPEKVVAVQFIEED